MYTCFYKNQSINEDKIIKNTKEPAFINRQTEIKYVREYLDKLAENILFIYDPKISGKTTALYVNSFVNCS